MNGKDKNKTLRVLLIIYLAGIIARIPAGFFPAYYISIFIYCVGVLYWAFSVRSRIIEDRQRRLLIAVAGMILLLHSLQILKYQFESSPAEFRYLWYMYYIPMVLAPLFSIWAAAGIGRSAGERLGRGYLLLLIPALILIILIMTNDLHQMMFSVDLTALKPDRDYTRGIVYYICTVWIYGLLGASLAVAVGRCTIAYPKKKAKIPLFVVLTGLVLLLVFYGGTSGGKRIFGTEILTFQMIWHVIFSLFWETCITIGLIPSNTDYDEIFTHAAVKAQILDRSKGRVYFAKDAGTIPEEVVKSDSDFSVFVKDNTKYYTKKINGGYVCWEEDISTVLEMNRELWESTEHLREENALLARESEVKAERTRIETYNRLYDEIASETDDQINGIKDILVSLRRCDADDFNRGVKRISILTAYIKRSANLMLIRKDKKMIRTFDLMLSIKESLEYAPFFDIAADVTQGADIEFPADDVIEAYKMFEFIFEGGLGIISAILIRIECDGAALAMIFEVSANGSSTDAVWNGYREYVNMGAARKTGYRYLITDDEAKTFRIKVMFDAKVDDREVAS